MLFFRKYKSAASQRGKQPKRLARQVTLSHFRSLRCEPLEDRRLLSVVYGPSSELDLPASQIMSPFAASVAESSAVPTGVDLVATSDTGFSNSDDLTNLDNSTPEQSLQFEVSGTIAGATVTIYSDGTAIGSTQATDTTAIVTTDGSYDIPDGSHSITARQTETGSTESEDAPPLALTIDTVASLQTDVVTEKLLASDGQEGDRFGHSVSICGTTAIVGAYKNDGSGTAYIFEYTDAGWQEVDKLVPSDGAADDYFGRDVAINGTTAIVRAYGDDDHGENSGAAYIFEQTDTGWQQVAKLTSGGSAFSYFGCSVALSGTTAIVGAYGVVCIFEKTDAGWQQVTTLTSADRAEGDSFGGNVSISGNFAIVSASRDDNSNGKDAGSAYIFEQTHAGWQQVAKLTSDDGAADDWFGYSVAISGNTAIVGAKLDDDRGDKSGSAYIFEETDGDWQQVAKLTADDGVAGDLFGYNVGIDGDAAIVGALRNDISGSAYLFKRIDNTWQQVDKQTSDSGVSGTGFGESVAISGPIYIVGACGDDGNESHSGSAFVFASRPTIDLQASCDSGFSDTDNITSDTTLTFDIAATPYYRLYCNGELVSDLYANSPHFTMPELSDGTYEFTVYAVDLAGNESTPSATLTITIDTVGPDITGVLPDLEDGSDTGISSTDNLTNDNTPSINVPEGLYYRVFLDGTEISNGLQSGSFTLPTLDDGTYEIAIIAADEAGNETEAMSDSISVTIDTTAPDAPAVAPDLQAASDTGISDSDDLTNDTTPTFDITASGYYQVYRDGVLESNLYETADSYTCTSLPLTDGNHDYSIVHVDEAGNESALSPTLCVTIDTVAPTRSNDFIAKLLDNHGEAADQFGCSVAISGTIAVVGARYDDAVGINSGSAFIFEQTAGGWEKVGKLIPRDSANCDYFGHSVAISGTTVIVGAYGDSVYGSCTGSAYIFELTDNGWEEVDKLIASDGAKSDWFGYSVAISGTRAIVGAYKSGSAYIFEQTDSGWEEVEKISDLGSNVAISGTTALVGPSVFEETHNGWEKVAKLTASGSMAICDDLIIVGSIIDDSNGEYAGAAYIFRRTASGWEETAKLTASDGEPGDYFGHSVAINGSTVIVGADGNDDNGDFSGSAYLFQRTSAGWEEVYKLIASDTTADNHFGSTVAISGATMIVGACNKDVMSDSLNSAYIFTGLPLSLQADSDTGVSNTDNIINDNTPTFDVRVHSYAPYYRIYRDGIQISGDYETAVSFTSVALPDGTYEFTICAVDEAGNEILPGFTQSVTVDTVAPSVSGIMPDLLAKSDRGLSDSENLTCDNTPAFDVPGTFYYRFFLDGIEVRSGYQCGNFTLPEQLDGTHDVAVIAVDAAGNESDLGDPTSITIDTVAPSPPTVAPDLQAASDSGLSDSDNITNDNTPSFDIVTSGYYRLYRDGTQVSGNYETISNHTALRLSDGTYDYTIVAVDEAGNKSAPSPLLSVTIDTASPLQPRLLMAKLLTDDGSSSDCFGYSVAISGTTAIIGAEFDEDNGSKAGAAYIFELTTSGWEQVAKLTASDGEADDHLGLSVAISGNIALVGARGDDDNGDFSGSAYVFERTANGWEQTAKLIASDGDPFDYFGTRVAISGTTAIVGAYGDDDNGSKSGAAYIFELTTTGWEQLAKLTASDGADFDYFGYSVAISGTTAIVGAKWDDDNGSTSGSAYLFKRTDNGWEQVDKLTANDGTCSDYFGVSVAISGTTAIIGADGDDDHGSRSGSAYIFECTDAGWEQVEKLTASDGATNDSFGTNVAINGTMVIVGAQQDDDHGSCSGSAYIFKRTDNGWKQVNKLIASDGAASDYFGASVAISESVAIVGALEKGPQNNNSSGSACIFSMLPQLDLQATSDWGVCDTDNITCSTMPIFDVVATPYYRIYRDGVQVSDDYETGSSYISEKLSEGVYEFTVSAVDAAGNETLLSMPLTVTIETCTPVPGDANEDGNVDGFDGAIFAANWRAGVNDGQTATWSMGDFNYDGKVDSIDLAIFRNSWRASVDSTGAGEEPGGAGVSFTPPANASLGIAAVPQRESLPPRRLITPTPEATTVVEAEAVVVATPAMATDTVLAESTWSESDFTAVAKDLVAASAKRSTTAKDELYVLEIDPYADLD